MREPSLAERIGRETDRVLDDIRRLRQSLHAEPELGMQEVETRSKVLRALDGLPLGVRAPFLGTDVVADLDAGSSRTVCLRADMDALPIAEAPGRPHRSRRPGVMHACGHDGHTAMLVGAARVLCRLKERLPCNVRFVFQPAEEILCAGKHLVARGACEGTAAAFALHAWPGRRAGDIGSRAGILFAGASFFRCQFTGVACHGSMPERGRNPIPPAAEAVARIETLRRELCAGPRTVVSVCTFHAGAASNSIPETASFEGSLRYLDRPTGDRVESAVRCLVEDTARAAGVSAEFTADRRYEYPVVNHPELHALLRETVCESLSPERFHEVEEPTMGSEDFAYYTQARPGLMFWLYMGEKSPPLHSPHFDFNDEALRHGIVTLCRLAAVPPERLPASPDA